MAYFRKRGSAYQIIVSCGYDSHGHQIEQRKTFRPDPKMTPKQVEKELNRIAVKFEEGCKNGYVTATTKFEDFAENTWFPEYAELSLSPQTLRTYHALKKRLYKSFGHIRIDKITTRTIQKFIKELSETEKKSSKGKPIGKLSYKCIKNHVALASSILEYAVKMQMIQQNPCRNVTFPKATKKERKVYTLEEVQQMLELFEHESTANFKYVMFYTLAVFTGLRRGELLGLEWNNFRHILTSTTSQTFPLFTQFVNSQ